MYDSPAMFNPGLDARKEYHDLLRRIQRHNFERKTFYHQPHVTSWMLEKAPNTDSSNAERLVKEVYDHNQNTFPPRLGENLNLLVFSVLLHEEIQCGHMVHIFQRELPKSYHLQLEDLSKAYERILHDLETSHPQLPSKTRLSNYSEVIETFEKLRWSFVPYQLHLNMNPTISHPSAILPFCYREIINDKGGQASVCLHGIQEDLVEDAALRKALEPSRNEDKGHGPCYELAVKSYMDKHTYEIESQAFQGIRHQQGVVQYLGEYRLEHHTLHFPDFPSHHIMLEYGEMDLDEYLAETYPPVLNEEIRGFWEEFFTYENFNERRKIAIKALKTKQARDRRTSVQYCEDAFHDGKNVLSAVTEWHVYLRNSARRADTTTHRVLDLVDKHMLLSNPEERLMMGKLCEALDANPIPGDGQQQEKIPDIRLDSSDSPSVEKPPPMRPPQEPLDAQPYKTTSPESIPPGYSASHELLNATKPGTLENPQSAATEAGASPSGRSDVFVVDNAYSMLSHWNNLKTTLLALAMKIGSLDKDGLDLVYTCGNTHNVKGAKGWDIPKAFGQSIDRARSIMDQQDETNIEETLSKCFDTHSATNMSQRQTLIVLTNGLWEGSKDWDSAEKEIARYVDALRGNLKKREKRWFTIQFISFGQDQKALKRLEELDDNLHGPDGRIVEDIVDTKPCGAPHIDELFDKRGAIYSNRPINHVLTKHIWPGPHDKAVPILQYDEYYPRWRKTFSYILSNAGIKRLLPLLEAEASTLCQNLRRDKSSFKNHVQSWSLAVLLVATSGQRMEALPHGFAEEFMHAQEGVLQFLIPGSAPLVDYFPVLKYVPKAFASWKREAPRVRKLIVKDAMAFFLAGREQYEQMKEDPASVRVEGLIAKLLREQNTPGLVKPERRFADLELGYLGQAAIGAAADTTASSFLSLICCFAAFPDVLKKAQEEVDQVAGNTPPTGDMLGKLVYLKACVSEDDQYGDYFFPKGTTFIANAWTIHRDEKDYERPDEFMPERFVKHPYGLRRSNDAPATEEDLEKSGRRALYVFGSGRRQCPGEQFAFTTIMLAASKVVWAFDVLPPPGGVDVSIETGYKDNIVAEPADPSVIFKVRDADREAALGEDGSRTDGIAREMLG
ncbi:hypothetical protein SLS64_006841 [Diaporthe eres]